MDISLLDLVVCDELNRVLSLVYGMICFYFCIDNKFDALDDGDDDDDVWAS